MLVKSQRKAGRPRMRKFQQMKVAMTLQRDLVKEEEGRRWSMLTRRRRRRLKQRLVQVKRSQRQVKLVKEAKTISLLRKEKPWKLELVREKRRRQKNLELCFFRIVTNFIYLLKYIFTQRKHASMLMRDVEKGGVEKRETWVGDVADDVADDGGDDQVAGR